MQGIFRKENTDKALKYGIYRHLPTYEKIIRNLVSFFINEVVPKNRHPHLRLKHRHADAEHIRLETNTMMFLIMFSPDFMVEKYEKSRKILN